LKIIVTGSQSFIGGALERACREKGIGWFGVDTAEGATLRADIRDPALAAQLPDDASALVHLAAISRQTDCRRDPALAFSVNVGGTLNLIDAAARAGIRQFLFASSEWVYGDVHNGSVQTESSPIDIMRFHSEYALTKINGERLLAMAHQQGRLPAVTILRFGIVYGPRPANWSAVEALYHAVRDTGAADVNGALATSRRFIHVGDIAAGIVAALGRTGFEIFNLSGDSLISLAEVIRVSAEVCGRNPQIREADPAAVSIRNPDNARARLELGWKPSIALREGLLTLAG
jgi:UDP-glucose 4-epimerase